MVSRMLSSQVPADFIPNICGIFVDWLSLVPTLEIYLFWCTPWIWQCCSGAYILICWTDPTLFHEDLELSLAKYMHESCHFYVTYGAVFLNIVVLFFIQIY